MNRIGSSGYQSTGFDSINDTPPQGKGGDGQLSDEEFSRRLELALHADELKDREQDRDLRKEYVGNAVTITKAWLVGVGVLLLAHGIVYLKPWFSLSDQVVSVVFGTTTVTVVGLLIAVPKYVLPQNRKNKPSNDGS